MRRDAQRSRRRRRFAAAISAVLLVGLSALPFPDVPPAHALDLQGPAEALGWPAGDPKVALEGELSTESPGAFAGFLRKVAGQRARPLFTRPYGVAWSGDDLLVTDPGSRQVLRIDPRGRTRRSPSGVFESPIGVTACSAGIFVADSRLGRVAQLDTDLRLMRWVAEELGRPTGLSCIADRLFVVDTSRHQVFLFEPPKAYGGDRDAGGDTAAGGGAFASSANEDAPKNLWPDRTTRVLGHRGEAPGEFNYPTLLGSGAESLWVGDTLNFRVQRFDPQTGQLLGSFGQLGDAPGEMPRIKGLAVDASGRLWISDAHLDQVALYEADGEFLMSIGGPGSRPGEFSFPAGIAAHPDGRVAVVDSLNRRLQIFRLIQPDRLERR